jgi:CheY-like chemotaxis protein
MIRMSSIKPPKIFVVEDNPIYQELIIKSLESVSDDIHLFLSGETCLEEMRQSPSVIVMDYRLEGKINGLTTIRKIRRTNPHVYVILFSTDAGLDTQQNLQEYGDFDYLKKTIYAFPLLKQMINASIQTIINSPVSSN